MNKYLRLREQPETEAEFYERYHIQMNMASNLLKKLHTRYKQQNPCCRISYERSYPAKLLTFLFEAAGNNYAGMLERIDTVDCDRIPLHYFIAAIANVSNQKVEDIVCGRKQKI